MPVAQIPSPSYGSAPKIKASTISHGKSTAKATFFLSQEGAFLASRAFQF